MKNGVEVRLAALVERAEEEGEQVRQQQEDDDDDVGERRREVTRELAPQDDSYGFQGRLLGSWRQAATARNTSSRRPEGARALRRRGRVVGHQLAARDDDGARAHGVDFFEDVRGDDDGLLARDLADQRADFVFLQRIETVGGLVEDQHLGVVHDGLREADAPLEALGQRFDGLLRAPARAAAGR